MQSQVTPRHQDEVTRALLSKGARVGVFRALYLGDLLCAIPAVRALKRANPSMALTLLGLPRASEFAARFAHYFEAFIAIPPTPELHAADSNPLGLAEARAECRARSFDAVLQLHGSGPQSNAVVLGMGAKHVAGFHPSGAPPPEGGSFWPHPERGTEVERLLALVSALGIPGAGTGLEFPITAEDEAAYEALARRQGLRAGEYVCVHPGGKLASRRWPPASFARVADALAAQDYRVVFTGTASERGITREVRDAMRHEAVDVAGETRLGALGVLIDRAALLVSNDTSVVHIAAALGTPSVTVACGSDTARWAPADASLHRTLAVDVECRPCAFDECPIGHPCATGLRWEEVAQAAHGMLLSGRAAAL